ncbi:hypothetical protein VTK56DRAFT_6896 [Thermocarpiscus australiensis]
MDKGGLGLLEGPSTWTVKPSSDLENDILFLDVTGRHGEKQPTDTKLKIPLRVVKRKLYLDERTARDRLCLDIAWDELEKPNPGARDEQKLFLDGLGGKHVISRLWKKRHRTGHVDARSAQPRGEAGDAASNSDSDNEPSAKRRQSGRLPGLKKVAEDPGTPTLPKADPQPNEGSGAPLAERRKPRDPPGPSRRSSSSSSSADTIPNAPPSRRPAPSGQGKVPSREAR